MKLIKYASFPIALAWNKYEIVMVVTDSKSASGSTNVVYTELQYAVMQGVFLEWMVPFVALVSEVL